MSPGSHAFWDPGARASSVTRSERPNAQMNPSQGSLTGTERMVSSGFLGNPGRRWIEAAGKGIGNTWLMGTRAWQGEHRCGMNSPGNSCSPAPDTCGFMLLTRAWCSSAGSNDQPPLPVFPDRGRSFPWSKPLLGPCVWEAVCLPPAVSHFSRTETHSATTAWTRAPQNLGLHLWRHPFLVILLSDPGSQNDRPARLGVTHLPAFSARTALWSH